MKTRILKTAVAAMAITGFICIPLSPASLRVFAADISEIFVQTGHSEGIQSLAYSPDGRYLISGSEDKTVKLWEISTGREVKTFDAPNAVRNVAFSPDGVHIAAGGTGDYMQVWNVWTGREVLRKDKYYSVVFSHDGKLAVGGSYGKVTVWEVPSGREVGTFNGKSEWFNSVAFSPDDKCILIRGYDYLKIWDFATGKEITIDPPGKEKTVWSEAFSPDGKLVVFACGEKKFYLASADTGKVIKTGGSESLEYDITLAAFTRDKNLILTNGGNLNLWDSRTGELTRILSPKTSAGKAVFSPDGKNVAISNFWAEKKIKILDMETGRQTSSIGGYGINVRSVAISRDSNLIAYGDARGDIRIWDVPAAKQARLLKASDGRWIGSLAFSPDDKYLISGCTDALVRIWDVATGKEIRSLKGHTNNVESVAVSPDGKHIVSGSWDKTVRLWEVQSGKEEKKFTGCPDHVESVSFSPSGKQIAAACGSVLKLWDVATEGEGRTLTTPYHSAFRSVAFSPSGDYLISGGVNNRVERWDTQTGKLTWSAEGHSDWIKSVAVSPDGKFIISGSWDKTARVWDPQSGKEIRTLKGDTGRLESVAVSANGRWAVSGSLDSSVRLWNAESGKELGRMVAFADGEWIVITPEGYFNSSQNGPKNLNVRVNNNVYSIDNFYEKFFNPVYVASVFQGRKVEALADIRHGVLTPPEVRITAPQPNETFDKETTTITVSARDTGGGIDEIRLYHNGKAVGEGVRSVRVVPAGKDAIKQYTVNLVEGVNTFRAVGFSKDRIESNPVELVVSLSAPRKELAMHVLAVGINVYRNSALNLNYAIPDAKGITDFFTEKGKSLFKVVEVVTLFNESATKANIVTRLKDLEKTNPQDVVLVYLAGHGESISDKWYFIPHELVYPERENEVTSKGVSSDELARFIRNIRAQKILIIIDSCKAGAMLLAMRGFEDRKALSQLSRSTGVHVIAASTKDQYAAEINELHHGVFTYTLLEGLNGKAAQGDKTITVRKLMAHVENSLPDLTVKYRKETQFPVVDSRGMDFPLVILP